MRVSARTLPIVLVLIQSLAAHPIAIAHDVDEKFLADMATLSKKRLQLSGQRVAVYGRISMRLEDTRLDDLCRGGTRKGSAISGNGVELMLFDEAKEYTDKEGLQYQFNLKKYSKLHHKCGWVVGIFSPDDGAENSIGHSGTLKKITYIGTRRPNRLD
jgi:hypothetical protein